jgi:hypothetical protein
MCGGVDTPCFGWLAGFPLGRSTPQMAVKRAKVETRWRVRSSFAWRVRQPGLGARGFGRGAPRAPLAGARDEPQASRSGDEQSARERGAIPRCMPNGWFLSVDTASLRDSVAGGYSVPPLHPSRCSPSRPPIRRGRSSFGRRSQPEVRHVHAQELVANLWRTCGAGH